MQNMIVLINICGLNNLDSSGVGNWVSWFRVLGDWGIFWMDFFSFLIIINVKWFSSGRTLLCRSSQRVPVQKNLRESTLASKFSYLFPIKVGQSRLTDRQIPGSSTTGKCHTVDTTFETTTLKWSQSRAYRQQPITSDFSSQSKPGAWAYQVKGIWKELLHF